MEKEVFKNILDVWDKYIEEDPKFVNLSDTYGNNFTRRESDDIASKVYRYLKNNGIGKDTFVLINLQRSYKPICAVIGVLKAGAAFALVENTYAPERIAFIKKDCNAQIEINEEVWPEILKLEPLRGHEEVDDHDLCLSLYTSGTTGTPKGVLHEYGQIKYTIMSQLRPDGSFNETPKTRFGSVAPLNFAASIKTMFHFVYCGGHIYIIDDATVKNPRKLDLFFVKNRINETFLSPSLLRMKGNELGPFVKHLYTGSEPANNCYLKNGIVDNLYCMSESLFTVCSFRIEKPYAVCPIGNPNFDLDIKIVKEDGSLAKKGEKGEFCYRNPYCRGYINNPKENEIHFKDGYFHTGDLAVYKDGNYVLLGRSDDMIKIDGNRIEPSEIEAAFNSITGASTSVAKGFEKEGFIVLYYKDNLTFNEDEVIEKLKNKLPYYMIPSIFIKVEAFPLTASGKVDKKNLPLPKEQLLEKYVAPKDEFEEKLVKAFQDILEIKKLGVKDDFFKLGGNSIKAMEVLSKLDDEVLSSAIIYKGRTVEKIAKLYYEAKKNFLTIEQKEELGKKLSQPLNHQQKFFYSTVSDLSIDFYRCYRFNKYVPSKKIVDGINAYIAKNSSFNLVLNKDKNGNIYQVYNSKKPSVKIEKAKESDIKSLVKNFVRPFGVNEPLIRFKVVKTALYSYLFFHGSHVVLDGASVHFLMEDLMKCINGSASDITETYAFAWLYDESQNLLINRSEDKKWYDQTYFTQDYNFSVKTDSSGKGTSMFTRDVKINLNKVNEYIKKNNITINLLINSAVLFAKCEFNNNRKEAIYWNYDNRKNAKDKAGVTIKPLISAIDLDKVSSLVDIFTSINEQNQQQFDKVYYNFAVSNTNYTKPQVTVTYIADWFNKPMSNFIAKEITLENNNIDPNKPRNLSLFTFSHDKDNLIFNYNYYSNLITKESADKFINLVEFAFNEILENRVPKFNK